jgi:hypothetical protein
MARAPRKLSATSGQGVSRKSYQTARSLGQSGTGSSFKSGLKDTPMGSNSRDYAKSSGYQAPKSVMNIDYGDTLPISNLGDLKKLGKKR